MTVGIDESIIGMEKALEKYEVVRFRSHYVIAGLLNWLFSVSETHSLFVVKQDSLPGRFWRNGEHSDQSFCRPYFKMSSPSEYNEGISTRRCNVSFSRCLGSKCRSFTKNAAVSLNSH
jgi:hypothetical protein